MSTPIATVLTLGLLASGPPPDALMVFGGVPPSEGRWRIEVTSQGQEVPAVTICTDAFSDMKAKLQPDKLNAKGVPGCRPTIVRDDAKRAEMKITCGSAKSMRVRIERNGKSTWTIRIDEGDEVQMSARYRHLGACQKGDAEVTFDADSEQCTQMKAQLQMLNPSICAAQAGDAKAACEAQIAEARKKLDGMCK